MLSHTYDSSVTVCLITPTQSPVTLTPSHLHSHTFKHAGAYSLIFTPTHSYTPTHSHSHLSSPIHVCSRHVHEVLVDVRCTNAAHRYVHIVQVAVRLTNTQTCAMVESRFWRMAVHVLLLAIEACRPEHHLGLALVLCLQLQQSLPTLQHTSKRRKVMVVGQIVRDHGFAKVWEV